MMREAPVYLDADIFLALIKEDDRYKQSAQHFFQSRPNHEWVTSSLTCLEIWFYLYKHQQQEKALDAIRAVLAIATIIEYGIKEIEAATLLASQHQLSPADAIHATIALPFGTIVSTDHSFDRLAHCQRIDFSKE